MWEQIFCFGSKVAENWNKPFISWRKGLMDLLWHVNNFNYKIKFICYWQLSNSAKPISKKPEEVEVKPTEVQTAVEITKPSEIHETVPTVQQEVNVELEEQNVEDDSMIKISESEVYKKYFKMLKVGIPMMAVKQKMQSEGLDCDLNNPNLMINKSE